jgi:hypothetical protein
MKFFDSVGDPKTDSMFNFICNVICMAVLAPVKLIREIMKKAVYLSRAQIDKLFFASICFGLFFTVLSVAIRYSKKQFSLLTGRLPIVVMIVADVIIFVCYAIFSSSKFIVYDNDVKKVVKAEAKIVEATKRSEMKSADTVDTAEMVDTVETVDIVDTTNSTAEYDSSDGRVSEKEESEKPDGIGMYDPILDSQELRNYQTKLRNGVEGLKELQEITMRDAEKNLKELKESLDAITPPSKFLNNSMVQRIVSQDNLMDLDESVLQDIEDIPMDFKLFS